MEFLNKNLTQTFQFGHLSLFENVSFAIVFSKKRKLHRLYKCPKLLR